MSSRNEKRRTKKTIKRVSPDSKSNTRGTMYDPYRNRGRPLYTNEELSVYSESEKENHHKKNKFRKNTRMSRFRRDTDTSDCEDEEIRYTRDRKSNYKRSSVQVRREYIRVDRFDGTTPLEVFSANLIIAV